MSAGAVLWDAQHGSASTAALQTRRARPRSGTGARTSGPLLWPARPCGLQGTPWIPPMREAGVDARGPELARGHLARFCAQPGAADCGGHLGLGQRAKRTGTSAVRQRRAGLWPAFVVSQTLRVVGDTLDLPTHKAAGTPAVRKRRAGILSAFVLSQTLRLVGDTLDLASAQSGRGRPRSDSGARASCPLHLRIQSKSETPYSGRCNL